MINNFIKQVSEFHKAFGIEKGNVNTQLRYDLFLEEFNEYKDAKDLVEKTDAICDMMYIACGTIDVHELDLNWFKRLEPIAVDTESEIIFDIEKGLTAYLNFNKTESNDKNKLLVSILRGLIGAIIDLSVLNNVYDILPELFTAVQESNLSKLDDNGKPIINELNSEYYDSRKPLGKVLKSKNFFEPKLKEILIKHGKINA